MAKKVADQKDYVTKAFRVRKPLANRISFYAEKEGRSLSSYIVRVLEAHDKQIRGVVLQDL